MVFYFPKKRFINTQQQFCPMPGGIPPFHLSAISGVSGLKAFHPDTSTAPIDVRVRRGLVGSS